MTRSIPTQPFLSPPRLDVSRAYGLCTHLSLGVRCQHNLRLIRLHTRNSCRYRAVPSRVQVCIAAADEASCAMSSLVLGIEAGFRMDSRFLNALKLGVCSRLLLRSRWYLNERKRCSGLRPGLFKLGHRALFGVVTSESVVACYVSARYLSYSLLAECRLAIRDVVWGLRSGEQPSAEM